VSDRGNRGASRPAGGSPSSVVARPGSSWYRADTPTVLRSGPYRFFFYSGDGGEPAHVHVERDSSEAKFWLDPVRLGRSGGFSARELRTVQDLVEANRQALVESWNDHFDP
jgi:Domain of unknown function (DUF4160)